MIVSRRLTLAALAGAALVPAAGSPDAKAQAPGGMGLRDIPFGPAARHRLDIYQPAGPGPHPVVVFIYGGSWSSGSKQTYGFVGEALARQGFLTVIPDYRLVPEVRFPGFVEDGALALRFVVQSIRRYGGDPGRIGLLGHSAGAYNAMMLALDPGFLRRVGLGRSTIRRVAGLSGPYDFLPLDNATTVAAFGGTRDLARSQPVNLAGRGAPPVFLATGLADTTVLPRNSERLAAKLQAAGTSVVLRRYPGVGHAATIMAFHPFLGGLAPSLADVTGFFRAL
jgi:acetyl esterase/lipase